MQCGQVIAWTSFEAKVCVNIIFMLAWIDKRESAAKQNWSLTSQNFKRAFFGSLYRCLSRGARAVFQVYPENLAQRELILKQALQAGFGGGLVVDYPHRYVRSCGKLFLVTHFGTHLNTWECCLNCSTKKKKEFLVLTCGSVPTSIEDSCSEDDDDSEDDDSEDGKVNIRVSFTVFY